MRQDELQMAWVEMSCGSLEQYVIARLALSDALQ